MTSVQDVLTVLENAGFERLPKPLTVVGTEFDFEAAARGTNTSHDLVLVVSECQRNTVNKFIHLLTRRVETESLTRPIIELDHDCLNLCITDRIEISSLGIVITNETIEVFV